MHPGEQQAIHEGPRGGGAAHEDGVVLGEQVPARGAGSIEQGEHGWDERDRQRAVVVCAQLDGPPGRLGEGLHREGLGTPQALPSRRGRCPPPRTGRPPSGRPRGAGAGRRPTGGPRAGRPAPRSRGRRPCRAEPGSRTPAGFPVDPEVAATTATSAGNRFTGSHGGADHRPVGLPSRSPGRRASAGPVPSSAAASAGMSTARPAGPARDLETRRTGARRPPVGGLRLGGVSWRSQGRRPLAGSSQSPAGAGCSGDGPGCAVVGGPGGSGWCAGFGSGHWVAGRSRDRWSTCRGRPGGGVPSRAGPGSARSVVPPAAQSWTWWVWQLSAGIAHPGMMQPRSRAANARRWAGVAVRAVRPTASGIRVAEQGGGQGGDPRAAVGAGEAWSAYAEACPRCAVGGQQCRRRCRGSSAGVVDDDRGDQRVTGGEPGLGLGQGVPAGGGPHRVARGWWCPG